MPTIRLADIPNAGPQALGPSTGILAPQAAKLTGAAMVDSSTAVRGAKSMLDQTLALDAFSKEDAAMGKIAYQVGQIGEVALSYSEKMARAKDTADLARAETLMRSAFEKQQNEQMNTPVDKWQDLWLANVTQAQKAIGEIGISNNAANSLAPAFERWNTMSGLQIEGQANKKRIEGYQQDIEANAMMKIADDDIEGAIGIYNKAVADEIISESAGKLAVARLANDRARKAKAERNANIESAIILNPQKWERDLTGGLETGSSKLRTDISREEINRLYPFAKQQARLAESDKMEVFYNLIFKNEFQTTEELKAAMEDKTRPDLMPNVELPERAKQNLIKTFTLTPAQQDEAMKLFPALKHMAEAYDGADDPDMEKYISIGNQIRMLPEGRRDELLDILGAKHRAFRETKKPIPASALTSIEKRAEADLKAGGFGKWITDKNGNVTEDTRQARDEAYLRYDQEMTALKRWAKANPEKAQDDIEVQRAYNDIITQQNKLDAAAGRKPTRRPVDIPSLKPAPAQPAGVPDPDEVLRSSPTGASAPGKPVGKVTSYNFSGDPYSDSNSRNLIGAWNNTLTENSLAISPDIEKKFKAAGIKQGDAVELVLADGTRVVRNWDDRTMQDEEAIKRFGKPLRGRFDFHQPGGKYENDGIAVVSFRKATAA